MCKRFKKKQFFWKRKDKMLTTEDNTTLVENVETQQSTEIRQSMKLTKNTMTVYNQKLKEEGESTVYYGEDAYPYNKNGVLIVADGLGGRGGFPHKRFKEKILAMDENQLCDTIVKLIDPNLEKIGKTGDEFKDFIKRSFKEIIDSRDIYVNSNDEYNYRHSGYFASRLVTIIVAFCINFVDGFDKEELLKKISASELEIGKPITKKENEILKEYADNLQNEIKNRLKYICQRIGFEHEAISNSMYLLPTTLMVALTKESEDHVEVVNLWAGDCHSYVLDNIGLKKLTEDHEDGEIMTNLITADRDFYVDAKYTKLSKPCVILNASDGCYKCESYVFPMDMESDIINAFIDSYDNIQKEIEEKSKEAIEDFSPIYWNGISSTLENLYKEKGRHDDSNTMSLAVYGFENIEDIAEWIVDKRKNIDKMITELNEAYDKIGGSIGYKEIKQTRMIAPKEIIESIITEHIIYENKVVRDIVKDIMLRSSYDPYEQAVAKFNDTNLTDEQIAEIDLIMERYTKRYWRVNKRSILHEIWKDEKKRTEVLSPEIIDLVNEELEKDKNDENNKILDDSIRQIDCLIGKYVKEYEKYLKNIGDK